MRDPYDILGVARGASFGEIKAAYRRACKTRHPDMGGSHDEFIELQAAYDFLLKELKRGYQRQQQEAPGSGQAGSRQEKTSQSSGASSANSKPGSGDSAEKDQSQWQKTYRDIDEELEELRRAWQAREDTLRAMRSKAWSGGDRATWAKLTWVDLTRFIAGLARSGLKGIVVLVAALMGIGSVLVEANLVSGIILLFSGFGLLLSLALKNDKAGFMSAGLLLFGLMTIWLPPIRAALFMYPLATVSVIICLGLILKFGQQGGTVGLLTGGVLAFYMIGVIVESTKREVHVNLPVSRPPPPMPAIPIPTPQPAPVVSVPAAQPALIPEEQVTEIPKPFVPPIRNVAPVRPKPPPVVMPPAPPEPITMIAAQGAMLKLNSGIPYRLKLRTGMTTTLVAAKGSFAFDASPGQSDGCMISVELRERAADLPYAGHARTITACVGDAVVRVDTVR